MGKFVPERLQNEPQLRPSRAQRNRIAGRGARAPVVSVTPSVSVSDAGNSVISIEATCGFGGSDATAWTFDGGATLGDLAIAAAAHFKVEGGLVHLSVPGRLCVTPLDADAPLISALVA